MHLVNYHPPTFRTLCGRTLGGWISPSRSLVLCNRGRSLKGGGSRVYRSPEYTQVWESFWDVYLQQLSIFLFVQIPRQNAGDTVNTSVVFTAAMIIAMFSFQPEAKLRTLQRAF